MDASADDDSRAVAVLDNHRSFGCRSAGASPRDVLTAGAFTPGTVLAGRYRVIALLGRGGMGEVYRADDLKLGMAVALKFLPRALAADPSRYQRFLAEIRLSRQVSHPNVCRVHDIADIDGMPVLSMEYIDGEDLASLLKRIGRLPADKALDIARQIAAGLAAAHNRGVLHRDLKPANIMLDGRGGVRITDFGLAVAVDAGPLENDVSGTPAYMAPEQFTGGGASVRSDIYGLGLVLYELYTGRTAFSAPTLDALIDRKRHDTPALPSTLVADMDPVCRTRDRVQHCQRPAGASRVGRACGRGLTGRQSARRGAARRADALARARRGDGDQHRPVTLDGLGARGA